VLHSLPPKGAVIFCLSIPQSFLLVGLAPWTAPHRLLSNLLIPRRLMDLDGPLSVDEVLEEPLAEVTDEAEVGWQLDETSRGELETRLQLWEGLASEEQLTDLLR
jgi:hypothetical protein